MGGVSGAFLLLPFMVSVLGFTSPAVSPTNLVFNIVAIPSGVYRYFREGRMIGPLAWVVVAGTLPGVFIGGWIRLEYLPEPRPFKAFVGCVLLYISLRMFWDMRKKPKKEQQGEPEGGFRAAMHSFTWRRLEFDFDGRRYGVGVPSLFTLSAVVGIVGGIYGIGGGSIVAPFYVAIYGLPVHAVAGAALLGTFVTSIAGVIFYQLAAPYYSASGMTVSADWLLGGLFGLGGLVGMYLGARLQRLVPAKWLKLMLALVLILLAVRYVSAYLLS